MPDSTSKPIVVQGRFDPDVQFDLEMFALGVTNARSVVINDDSTSSLYQIPGSKRAAVLALLKRKGFTILSNE